MRVVSEDQLRRRGEAHGEDRALGVIGEPPMNVLTLNLGLDAMQEGGR